MKKDFLALNAFTKTELDGLFALAKDLKQKQKKGIDHHLLKGKTLGHDLREILHPDPGFLRGRYLSSLAGTALFISSGTSQMGRGEPIKDTARTLARYCDGIMITDLRAGDRRRAGRLLNDSGDKRSDRSLSSLPGDGGSHDGDRAQGWI